MDVIVAQVEQDAVWELRDLLGRSMGRITADGGAYFVAPAGEAIKTMSLVRCGPHASLDAALAEIETRTRGVCRRQD